MRKRDRNWIMAIMRTRGRLKEPQRSFPMPFLIGAALVLLLMMLTNLNLNPHLGHRAEPLIYDGPVAEQSGLWLSVFLENEKIFVTTNNRKVFSWHADLKNFDELKEFRTFLQSRSRDILHDGAKEENLALKNTLATISVDQKLTYFHVKPILQALADARFSRYAFETKLMQRPK